MLIIQEMATTSAAMLADTCKKLSGDLSTQHRLTHPYPAGREYNNPRENLTQNAWSDRRPTTTSLHRAVLTGSDIAQIAGAVEQLVCGWFSDLRCLAVQKHQP